MSSRELTMIEIKEVLRRWQAAQSLHQIARETALDRKTVRRYLGRPSSAGWPVATASTELLRVNWHCLDPMRPCGRETELQRCNTGGLTARMDVPKFAGPVQ